MVIAQAQKIEMEGEAIVFTFAPVHRHLRGQLEANRTWIEQLAHAAAGRKISVIAREGAAPPAPEKTTDAADPKQADLKRRAQAEPTVQDVLDIFGGEIQDVEEIDSSKDVH
jgi:hypothetical protein